MPWFKVDDKLHDKGKARRAGVAAMGLWTLSGSWSADNLTDGFVPEEVALRWTPKARQLAARLVSVNLWAETEQDSERGWVFLGWSDYQPTKAQVEDERKREAERKARWRASKGQMSRRDKSGTDTGTDDGTDAGLTPVSRSSRPDPTRPDQETTSPSETRKRATQLPAGFAVTDGMYAWAADKGLDRGRVDAETERWRDHHAAKGSTFKDWTAAWRTWMSRAGEYGPRPPGNVRQMPQRSPSSPRDEWMDRA